MDILDHTAPPSLLVVADRVEARLERVFEVEIARWRKLSSDLEPPLESLRSLVMSGGKRLRPAFCYWGFIGAGGDPEDRDVIDAGAAFEMLQAFALVHDDVMDGSSMRRGARTAHLAYGDRHAGDGWRGEPRRFGEGVAILIGDLAHVYADQLLPRTHPDVQRVWDELRIELNMGQYLDLLGTARADIDPVAARRIARYKSGKYTIERPLHVGAALAGRLPELEAQLSAYGDPLGEAFQLRDDLLGAFGEESATGKPVGDDLREGKPTPLLAAAAATADPAQAEVLGEVGTPDLDDEDIAAIQQVLTDTGAVRVIERSIDELTAEALAAIERADIAEEARAALVELAHFVAWRDA
ncbi:MAG TPA: polyprenyl synthetase family protein [Acidimicrobiales bacterium]|nr:polyprenyl synthetase family protein [Acidimicrobiales bacterium]